MKDNEWIKNLKVGDEIAIDISGRWNRNIYAKVTITKVTPTGRIKTSNGHQFYPDGREIGSNSALSPLRQLTPKIIELIKRKELLDGLKFNEFAGLLSSERLHILREWQKELINK